MAQEQAITWKELKDFINGLPEDVLSNRVLVSGVDQGFRIQEASVFEEDQRDGGEGYCSESDLIPTLEEEQSLEDYPIVHKKGAPMLFTDIETETTGSGDK